jgi:hypothetical protein
MMNPFNPYYLIIFIGPDNLRQQQAGAHLHNQMPYWRGIPPHPSNPGDCPTGLLVYGRLSAYWSQDSFWFLQLSQLRNILEQCRLPEYYNGPAHRNRLLSGRQEHVLLQNSRVTLAAQI